jgi:hypothetical protein
MKPISASPLFFGRGIIASGAPIDTARAAVPVRPNRYAAGKLKGA